MYGHQGKILHVDLSKGKTWVEEIPEDWRRLYIAPGENKLIVAVWLKVDKLLSGSDVYCTTGKTGSVREGESVGDAKRQRIIRPKNIPGIDILDVQPGFANFVIN